MTKDKFLKMVVDALKIELPDILVLGGMTTDGAGFEVAIQFSYDWNDDGIEDRVIAPFVHSVVCQQKEHGGTVLIVGEHLDRVFVKGYRQ